MKRASKSVCILAALALSGCNMAPRYARPALPVPDRTPGGPAYAEAAAQADSPEEAVDLAAMSYAEFFTDPRLRGTIEVALENNRDLRKAVANVEQARAQFRVQRADIFPTIGAEAGATYQDSPLSTSTQGGSGRTDIYSVSAGVSAWEIDLFGRLRNLSESARQEFFAARRNRDAARVTLVAEVATAWLALAADRERLAIARKTADAFRQTVELTQARLESGIASELEVRQARTSYDQARTDIAELTTLIAQDRNALNLLAGTVLDEELLPDTLSDGDVTVVQLPSSLPSQVLLARPDVAAAEHRLIAANADIGAARAAFFPNISLTSAFGTISMGLSGLFDGGSESWSVAPSASVSIFDFGRNSGNLRYARATYDAMVADYEGTVQTAFREVADALARRGTIDEQLQAQMSLRDNAQQAYRLADARFRFGVEGFLNSLDSQRSFYAAEQSLIATRLAKDVNAVELYRATGGGLQ